MPGIYHDTPIPRRKDGRTRRPSSVRPSRTSGWNFISQEELYGGRRTGRAEAAVAQAPEKIRALLEMTAQYEVEEEKRAEAFLSQARLMESYEDDYQMRSVPVRHIFTGYQEMGADELRGYFAWRSRIRAGEKPPAWRDFIRLYCAEQINLIGAKTPEEAFGNLLRIQALSQGQTKEGTYEDLATKGVLRDFVIAYGMDRDLALSYCIEDAEEEAERLCLADADTADDYSLYAAICHMIPTQVESSRFLPTVREDACHVIARSIRMLNRKERKQRESGVLDRLLGPVKQTRHPLFAWLPFCAEHADGYRYEVDPVRAYEYREGTWYCASRSAAHDPDDLNLLSELVRECERILRKSLHYKNVLPDRRKDPAAEAVIREVIRQWLKEKEERNRPEVRIDLTRLSRIRAEADVTTQRLLEGTEEAEEEALWALMPPEDPKAHEKNEVHEEHTEHEEHGQTQGEYGQTQAEHGQTQAEHGQTQGEHGQTQAEHGQTQEEEAYLPESSIGEGAEEEESSIFTKEETAFLRLVLEGKPWEAFLSERHLMLTVFTDAINEKAYDLIGDSIIEIEDGVPELVEDYREEVLQMI